LNADNTLSLQETGQVYHGKFVVNGNLLEITLDPDTKTTATVEGNKLTDTSGETWVLREQSAPPGSTENVLRNQDIIKMVGVQLADEIIIASIKTSNCQFDTSADALIQLKQSGVSDAVLTAMLGTRK
jgi:hypothetical protein